MPLASAKKLPPGLRDPLDYSTTRKLVFDGVLSGLQTRYPLENDRYRLELADLAYHGPEHYSLADQKQAILSRGSLTRQLRGTWRLTDKATGTPVDQKSTTVARVPYLTNRGTYIVGGNEYTVSNQLRLRPGVYARRKESGEHEAHFNVLDGGPSFRILMEPNTGVFRMNIGQAKIKLYPVLRAMGVTDSELQSWWGRDLYAANVAGSDKRDLALSKAWARLSRARAQKEAGGVPERDFVMLFNGFKLDPRVTERTLGEGFDRVTPRAVLRATQKLNNIAHKVEEVDDRDSLAYQDAWGPEDLFKERVEKDAGRIAHRALWKATLRGNLGGVGSSLLTPQLESLFYKSGLAQPLEETNSMDAVDQNLKILRIGEGGMAKEMVHDEARNVQPSHFLFLDPVRSPESSNVGVDSRIAIDTYKGADRRLYSRVLDAKGAETFIAPEQLVDSVVAFPGERERAAKEGRLRLKVMARGKLAYREPKDVDYYAPDAEGMFNLSSNLVPMISGIKGGRLLMGSKMLQQALPLEAGEAPLVQEASSGGRTFESIAGQYAGVTRADVGGQVVGVTPTEIKIQTPTGDVQSYELYNNFPMNRKTMLHSKPQVAVGDLVSTGQLLATSNLSDKEGNIALGRNLKVAYIPWGGKNFEDATVISQSAARKMASEHMYTRKIDADNLLAVNRSRFLSLFPSTYTKAQFDNVDENGVVKPGTIVQEDDPLILATQTRTPKGSGMVYRGHKNQYSDASVKWNHSFPGEVTDVWSDKDGVKVAIKGYAPMEIGDKIAGRVGDKHIVSAIIPDDEMLRDQNGEPIDIMVNPLGVISRGNPSQLAEAVLGKIAARTGRPYAIKGFMDDNIMDYAIKEMDKHGISDVEEVFDPTLNRKIPGVLVGNRFYQKLSHTVESKASERALGSYTMEGAPARSYEGEDKPKRIGLGEMAGLIAHGAVENIRELKTVKGQRNDEYWRAMTLGYNPPSPEIPNAYKKFMTLLQGAGINVKKQGDYLHLTALTDRDVTRMSSGEITSPEVVRWTSEYGRGVFGEQSLEPISGGLFDRGITGGHGGNRWSHYSLSEPMPAPVMEEPIQRILGLTHTQFEDVVAGRQNIPGIGSGTRAILEALKRVKVPQAIELNKEIAKTSRSGNERDLAIKKIKFLEALERQGAAPSDLMITKVPVIPPIFRPVTANSKFTMVTGINKLYKTLITADKNLAEAAGQLEGDPVHRARLNTYHALKAVTGLGDPLKPEERAQGVRGLLKDIFGGSPKAGMFQRRLIGTPVDLAGRTTIIPNPNLNMDQIGLPEAQAWTLYSPFVVRRLVRQAGSRPDGRAWAVRQVVGKSNIAKEALVKEMSERPMLAARAPALHKYSIMAFYPILAPGRALEISPTIVQGFNADFDGDAMNFHVVVGDKAIEEAKRKMLPSRNLRSPADFGILWAPRQEFLQGLYLASTKRSGRRMLPEFTSAREALAAFGRGQANIEDVVRIKE